MKNQNEEIVDKAIEKVKRTHNMLDGWNVGADTTPEKFIRDVIDEVLEKKNETDIEIMSEIEKAFTSFGAKPNLLSILGSYRDTYSDEDILEMLKEYNSPTPNQSSTNQ